MPPLREPRNRRTEPHVSRKMEVHPLQLPHQRHHAPQHRENSAGTRIHQFRPRMGPGRRSGQGHVHLGTPGRGPQGTGAGKQPDHRHLHRVRQVADIPAVDHARSGEHGEKGHHTGLLSHQGAGQRPGPPVAGVLQDHGPGARDRGTDRRGRPNGTARPGNAGCGNSNRHPRRLPRMAAPPGRDRCEHPQLPQKADRNHHRRGSRLRDRVRLQLRLPLPPGHHRGPAVRGRAAPQVHRSHRHHTGTGKAPGDTDGRGIQRHRGEPERRSPVPAGPLSPGAQPPGGESRRTSWRC